MKTPKDTPYKCHVFVCTNDRKGKRKSCTDANARQIRQQLKQQIKLRNLKPMVRVSKSDCLGVCDQGPNVMLYPQKTWFHSVTAEDIEQILDEIENAVSA